MATFNGYGMPRLDMSSLANIGLSQPTPGGAPLAEPVAQQQVERDGRQRQRPTFKNTRSLALTLDYDPTLAWHAAMHDDTILQLALLLEPLLQQH